MNCAGAWTFVTCPSDSRPATHNFPALSHEAGPIQVRNCAPRNSGIRRGWTAGNAWPRILSRHYTLDGAQTTRSAINLREQSAMIVDVHTNLPSHRGPVPPSDVEIDRGMRSGSGTFCSHDELDGRPSSRTMAPCDRAITFGIAPSPLQPRCQVNEAARVARPHEPERHRRRGGAPGPR